jgi:hypothetical protein
MPARTLEQVERKQAALKESIAELGEGADPAKRRTMRKRLRRAQRKRRKMKRSAERGAGPEAKPAAE